MKRRFLVLSLISIFALSGCEALDRFFGDNSTSEKDEKNQTDNNDNGIQNNENKIGEFYGGIVKNEVYTGYEFSKSEKEIEKPKTGIEDIKVYSFNDFHGAVLEKNSEIGLKRLGTFFKEKSKEDNTLILDQGDTWQGSFESNYQYGAIVQDVFNYAGVSARTVGNHDFDWGLNHLKATQSRKLGNDYIPYLGANVYDYENGINGTTQQGDYGKEYATFVLDSGIKVGVVGVIGSNQITTICSQLVDTICFTDHIEKVKELSDYLRVEKNCDIIIASTHESSRDIRNSGLSDISNVSNKRYCDLVLGGHAHYHQEYVENGLNYVQWDSNGESVGLITLKYDFDTNSLLDSRVKIDTFYINHLKTYYPNIDPQIEKMVDDYLEVTTPLSSEVLSNNFSGYYDTSALARLMSEAIFDRVSEFYPIDFAVCNYARSEYEGTIFTYGDLYRSFPFDNQIILMDISSLNSITSIQYNYSYREDTSLELSYGNSYKIAVIDYVGLHQNENRQYDYFPDATNVEIFNDTNGGEAPQYKDILYSYLKENPMKNFPASNYTTDNPHFYS